MSKARSRKRDLYVTGIPAADRLLRNDGTALLIGILLDQQVPMEWAFTAPHTIKKRLGHVDATKIAAMDVEDFVAMCRVTSAIHRFPASMGKRIHAMCAVLASDYKGKGANVWKDVTDAAELTKRLRTLPGFGAEKTEIFIALLGKRFGVRPKGWKKEAGEFSDNQPRSVADIHSPATLLKVRGYKKMQKANDLDKKYRALR